MRRLFVCTVVVVVSAGLVFGVAGAGAVSAGPGWALQAVAQPTNFVPGSEGEYVLTAVNAGGASTVAGVPVRIADVLPKLVHAIHIEGTDLKSDAGLACSLVPLQCVGGEVAVGDVLLMRVKVAVALGAAGSEANVASVSGGGAPAVSASDMTVFSSEAAAFGIADFAMQPFEADGLPASQASGHPYSLLATLDFNSVRVAGEDFAPGQVKDVVVDLPAGFVGDPQSVPKCPLWALLENSGRPGCPLASRVGTAMFESKGDTFHFSEERVASEVSSVYSMEPERGFPAEFGFTFFGKAVFMYASTVRVDGQLRLRVTVPGIPELEIMGATLLFFGDPGQRDLGVSSPTPFFTSPADCAAGPLPARAEVDAWEDPASRHGNVYPDVAESMVYPQVTGCGVLQFAPSLGIAPETAGADEPSGYTFSLNTPQNESPASSATPDLKNAVVTLPPGMSVSPAAADGLGACAATGPEGINIGEGQSTAPGSPGAGEDVGDPEASELGAGHLEGNGSPYDDGLYHAAPGHCPADSAVGTVEVATPLLPEPLTGHVYVAQPACGGPGQSECTPEDAQNGSLFGVYLEAAGSGVIVKLKGSVSVNPTTGQITATFRENPQVPFSSLKLHFDGGPRAALANPQTCGWAAGSADFSAWSSPFTPDAQSFPGFEVDGCEARFIPGFQAGMSSAAAKAFSSFAVTISRKDREGDLAGVQVTTPPGLLGVLAGVTRCGEPQASEGTCGPESQIGTVTTGVGAGSHPFWVQGRVYLTGPYDGAPFGLSVVVPAKAGPFNLGNVVVRAAISVNPTTAQITVTSGALPQVVDGVPLRVQTIDVDVDRPGFMFNPDDCEPLAVTGTLSSAQDQSASVSEPFQASGCKGLGFDPAITLSTKGKSTRLGGTSLYVKIVDRSTDAIAGKVKVALPKQLPARLSTLHKACLAAVFAANPAGCPAGAVVGFAKAYSPVLANPLDGPAYFVSNGNAKFPELVLVLEGEGVRVDLHGETNIKAGVTSSTFADIPDVPVSVFELVLPAGADSALTANGKGLCHTRMVAPNTFTAENGLVLKRSTAIAVSGCSTKAKASRARVEKARRARRARKAVLTRAYGVRVRGTGEAGRVK